MNVVLIMEDVVIYVRILKEVINVNVVLDMNECWMEEVAKVCM